MSYSIEFEGELYISNCSLKAYWMMCGIIQNYCGPFHTAPKYNSYGKYLLLPEEDINCRINSWMPCVGHLLKNLPEEGAIISGHLSWIGEDWGNAGNCDAGIILIYNNHAEIHTLFCPDQDKINSYNRIGPSVLARKILGMRVKQEVCQ